jgi:hypothetical protein
MLVNLNGQTYAVSVINNAGSSDGQSGCTVFSGNGLMLHASGQTIAAYSLKVSADRATVANNFASALGGARLH